MAEKNSSKFENLSPSGFNAVLFLLIALLVFLAFLNRFMTDDAFISFRYASNLASGHGLVFNPGEYVEGYTNFLWTLIIAGAVALGLDPVSFSMALGLACFAVSLFFTYRLGGLLSGGRGLGLLAAALLGANYTFNAYATGGLETPLIACLFVASAFTLFNAMDKDSIRNADMLALGLLLSAAVLTRPDAALLAGFALAVALSSILRAKEPGTRKTRLALCLVLPLAAIGVAYAAWKLATYGSFLPNTFHAKAGGSNMGSGLKYVYAFFLSYLLIPFPFLFVAAIGKLRAGKRRHVLNLGVFIFIWLLYVAWVGGDFMEFRFIAPVIPFIVVLVVWLVYRFAETGPLRLALIMIVLLGPLHHALTWGSFTYLERTQTLRMMDAQLHHESSDWIGIGRTLGEALGENPEIVIATSAAGAIPYYSKLTTIDVLGLTDSFVAHNGGTAGEMAGHRRRAPLSYLNERGTHLLIDHPHMERLGQTAPEGARLEDLVRFVDLREGELPKSSRVLKIPINGSYRLVCLYLKPHPAIERAIDERGWEETGIVVR